MTMMWKEALKRHPKQAGKGQKLWAGWWCGWALQSAGRQVLWVRFYGMQVGKCRGRQSIRSSCSSGEKVVAAEATYNIVTCDLLPVSPDFGSGKLVTAECCDGHNYKDPLQVSLIQHLPQF